MEKEWKKAKESRVVPHPKLNPGCATELVFTSQQVNSALFIAVIHLYFGPVPTTDLSVGKISNGDISATDHRIYSMFRYIIIWFSGRRIE